MEGPRDLDEKDDKDKEEEEEDSDGRSGCHDESMSGVQSKHEDDGDGDDFGTDDDEDGTDGTDDDEDDYLDGDPWRLFMRQCLIHLTALSSVSLGIKLGNPEVKLLSKMPNLRELSCRSLELRAKVDVHSCPWKTMEVYYLPAIQTLSHMLPFSQGSMRLRMGSVQFRPLPLQRALAALPKWDLGDGSNTEAARSRLEVAAGILARCLDGELSLHLHWSSPESMSSEAACSVFSALAPLAQRQEPVRISHIQFGNGWIPNGALIQAIDSLYQFGKLRDPTFISSIGFFSWWDSTDPLEFLDCFWTSLHNSPITSLLLSWSVFDGGGNVFDGAIFDEDFWDSMSSFCISVKRSFTLVLPQHNEHLRIAYISSRMTSRLIQFFQQENLGRLRLAAGLKGIVDVFFTKFYDIQFF